MRALKPNHSKTERLEARISSDQKKLFQHAASLTSKTLTEFTIGALEKAANQVIEEHESIQLSIHDQQVFIEALLDAPEPNHALLSAAERYKKEVQS